MALPRDWFLIAFQKRGKGDNALGPTWQLAQLALTKSHYWHCFNAMHNLSVPISDFQMLAGMHYWQRKVLECMQRYTYLCVRFMKNIEPPTDKICCWHWTAVIHYLLFMGGGWIGVSKSANPWQILCKSANPCQFLCQICRFVIIFAQIRILRS